MKNTPWKLLPQLQTKKGEKLTKVGLISTVQLGWLGFLQKCLT